MQKILHTGGTGFFSLTWSLDTEEKFKNFLLVNTKRNNLLKPESIVEIINKKYPEMWDIYKTKEIYKQKIKQMIVKNNY